MKITFFTLTFAFALGLALISSSYGQKEELVGYWNFDDKANLGNDNSKEGNHSATKGNATWTKDGKFGGALSCDGKSWIEVPNSDSVSIKIDQVSLLLWVNFVEVENFYQHLIIKTTPGVQTAYHISLCRSGYATGGFYFDANTPDRALNMTKEAPEPDVWYHLAGIYDGKELQIYLDGKLAEGAKQEGFDNPAAQSGNLVQVKEPLTIGADMKGENGCRGLLDEIAVFNRVLTEEEIKIAMERGVVGLLAVKAKGKVVAVWGHLKREFE